ELYAGESLGVVGESGCGKSTLVRAALQLLRPDAGRVVWMGEALGDLPNSALRALRRDLQIIFQDPLGSLDPRMTVAQIVAQQQIVTLLGALKRESGMCLLFVSHNLALVRRLCERVLVLYLGRMMELAPSQDLYTRPLHPYTRELLTAVPVPDPDIQPARLARVGRGEPPSPLTPPSGCVYRTRCPHAAAVCRERIPAWEKLPDGRYVACHRWRELG